MTDPQTDTQIGYFGNDIATFGDRVTAAREAAGLSEENLARKLGIKLKTLQNWEWDLSEPRANRLQMLAGLLNVSMRWLLTGEGEGPTDIRGKALAQTDLGELLVDLRRARTQMQQMTDQMGRLEARVQTLIEVEDA